MTFTNPDDITEDLQRAIDAAAQAGGGRVALPAGRFGFRTLRLRGGVDLHLGAGCRLVASPRPADYVPLGYEHNEMGQVTSALFAIDETDLRLSGPGILDLNGSAFYHLDRPSRVETVGRAVTDLDLSEAPRTYDWRVNQPIFLLRCVRVRVEGLTVVDAPCWTFSVAECRDVRFEGLTISNRMNLPNNDGIHVSACSGVRIEGCDISAGDDCIALSSITDWSLPCENVVISNCVLRSASKALALGFQHSHVRNVAISNCVVHDSNRSLVVMAQPGTGLVENVSVSNCVFEGRFYGGNWWGNGENVVIMATEQRMSHFRQAPPRRDGPDSVRNLRFSGLVCRSPRPIAVVAQKTGVRGVVFAGCTLQVTDEPRASLKGHRIDLAPGPENLAVPEGSTGVVLCGASVLLVDVVDAAGRPVKALNASLSGQA